MSLADKIFIENMTDILTNGYRDDELEVRPKWEDGTPAHTIKKFGVVNRYDLRKEFPILTLRKTNFRAAVDEILWIWQKKSNNIHDLNSHIWDSWADESGSIGKAYGYQLAQKHVYKEGEFDQVDRVLFDLKNNPQSRRILTNIYNFADLHEMNLYERYSQSAQQRYAGSQQLERGAVCGASEDVCSGKRTGGGGTYPRHQRRAHIRQAYPRGGKSVAEPRLRSPETHYESRRKGFL